jgi:mRNA-degrading endonuclease toxin of MazEF toxin-antitoxin module
MIVWLRLFLMYARAVCASTRANPYIFRPPITVPGHGETLALCDALTAVDPQARLGEYAGFLSLADVAGIDQALAGLLDLAIP